MYAVLAKVHKANKAAVAQAKAAVEIPPEVSQGNLKD